MSAEMGLKGTMDQEGQFGGDNCRVIVERWVDSGYTGRWLIWLMAKMWGWEMSAERMQGGSWAPGSGMGVVDAGREMMLA